MGSSCMADVVPPPWDVMFSRGGDKRIQAACHWVQHVQRQLREPGFSQPHFHAQTANAFLRLGLKDAGYTYVDGGEGWQSTKRANNGARVAARWND